MEIILYDVVLLKLFWFFLSNFVKIILILFLLLPKNWNYQTTCVYVGAYTLHSDEVFSLISGDESVVYSCSPMQWMLHCFVIKLLIYIDIYPCISLVSVLKNG